MKNRVGSPLHPRWTDFPAALWVASLLFDFGSILPIGAGNFFVRAAFYNVAAGCVLALGAVLTGTLDYNRIPAGHESRRIGLVHAGLNVGAFLLFGVNLVLRAQALDAGYTPFGQVVISAVAVGLVGVSSWLGGRMVFELGTHVAGATPPPTRPLHGRERSPT